MGYNYRYIKHKKRKIPKGQRKEDLKEGIAKEVEWECAKK